MSEDRGGGDIRIARYVPPVSVPDMERMAHAVVASRLFGITSVPQALTLMWLAQAEGRHPVLAARDYHIIEGKPTKTAEAMMRDFLAAGGSVEWHALDDRIADATFAHPRGGEVRITWDMERAAQAGLVGRRGDMWKKYPRQMLRSRTVSEGIRTVGPMATSGLYVPEEIGDYEARRPRMRDVTPAEPSRSAEFGPSETVDPATGEIVYEWNREREEQVEAAARAAAAKGTHALRAHLQTLTQAQRDALRSRLQPGELTRIAEAVPIPQPPAPQPEAAEQPRAEPDAAPTPSAEARGDTIPDMLGGEARPSPVRWRMPRDPSARDWQQFADWIDAQIADGISGGALRGDNRAALEALKRQDPVVYDAVQARLAAAR